MMTLSVNFPNPETPKTGFFNYGRRMYKITVLTL